MSEIEREDLPASITLPVDWHVPEGFPTSYASNMFVQAGEYEMFLSFFLAKPPLLTGSEAENRAKLEQLGTIQAECVSSIAVPADLVPKIIQALQTTWDAYTAAKKLKEGKKEV
jgi:hypothetical protein